MTILATDFLPAYDVGNLLGEFLSHSSNETPTTGVARSHQRVLGVVFFTVFLDLVGFGIIIPVQPFYAEILGASPTMVTWLGGSYSLMQFLFAPFWGRLSDRVGRRPVMLVSIATSALGYVLFARATELHWLFAARMLAGFGGANIGTAQAIIADSTEASKRAKGMGLIGAAFGLGFTIGPALGGSLVQFGLAAPAYLAAALSAANWIAAFFFLPETRSRKDASRDSRPNRPGFSWEALVHAARHTNVAVLFGLQLCFTFAFALMEQVIGLFIEKTWVGNGVASAVANADSRRAATLTASVLIVVGITAIIIQGGLIGRLASRFGERTLLRAGTWIVAVSLALIPVSGMGPFWGLLCVCGFMAIGTGVSNPSLSSLLSQSVDADEQGGVMGLAQSLSALGRVLGPACAGALFEITHGAPFYVGAVMMGGCGFLALLVKQGNRVAD